MLSAYEIRYREKIDSFQPGLWSDLGRVIALPAQTSQELIEYHLELVNKLMDKLLAFEIDESCIHSPTSITILDNIDQSESKIKYMPQCLLDEDFERIDKIGLLEV